MKKWRVTCPTGRKTDFNDRATADAWTDCGHFCLSAKHHTIEPVVV